MARAGPEKAVRPCQDRVRLFARCKLKQLCCYINPEFPVKMSDVSEYSGSVVTDLGSVGRENIWYSIMAQGPRCARSLPDLTP